MLPLFPCLTNEKRQSLVAAAPPQPSTTLPTHNTVIVRGRRGEGGSAAFDTNPRAVGRKITAPLSSPSPARREPPAFVFFLFFSPSREGIHHVQRALLRHPVHLLRPLPHNPAHALLEQPLELLLPRPLPSREGKQRSTRKKKETAVARQQQDVSIYIYIYSIHVQTTYQKPRKALEQTATRQSVLFVLFPTAVTRSCVVPGRTAGLVPVPQGSFVGGANDRPRAVRPSRALGNQQHTSFKAGFLVGR